MDTSTRLDELFRLWQQGHPRGDAPAAALGVSRATAFRDWTYARAILTADLAGNKDPDPP